MKNCNCFACKQQKEYEKSIIGMCEVPIYKCINQKQMKTKTIEVKFPTIEGMKVENASVDLKNGLSVVEYVEDDKFKKGDILFAEYNKSKELHDGYIAICSSEYNNSIDWLVYDVMLSVTGALLFAKSCSGGNFRLATDSEKQLLFDALEKDGKYWDIESLEVKELGVNDKIDRILFDLRNYSDSVADASEKIRNIIDKEVNKAVNKIYK